MRFEKGFLNLTCYAIPFVTAAAIVVPCLSTLVSDHGKTSYSFLFMMTHRPFGFYGVLSTLLLIIYCGYFLQARPVRRAQWWGFCVVWALWPEHWDQWCRPPVRKKDHSKGAKCTWNFSAVYEALVRTRKPLYIILLGKNCCLLRLCTQNHCVFFRSLLDSWSSDLFSPHISLFHYPPGSPENSWEAKRGVRHAKTFGCSVDLMNVLYIYICLENKHYLIRRHEQKNNNNNNKKMPRTVSWSNTYHKIMMHLPQQRDVIGWATNNICSCETWISFYTAIFYESLRFCILQKEHFILVVYKNVDILFSCTKNKRESQHLSMESNSFYWTFYETVLNEPFQWLMVPVPLS